MSNANELQHAVDELKFKGLVKEKLGESSTETITRFARTAPALSFLYLSEHTRSVIENAVKNVELCKECREITLDEACIIAIIRERTNFGASTIAVYAKGIYESINKHPVGDSEALIAASQIVSMMSNPSVGLLIETNDRYTINPDVELN
jgi:hypothetical protein